MHDRTRSSKRLLGETPPEFRSTGRDPRIDVCRGIALWWIFLDHIPDNVGSWLTLRNYGFCDAAEIFMFISGVTCALAYGRARQRDGWRGMIGRSLRRGWDIYAAFLLLTLACAILVYLAGSDRLADDSNTRVLFERPGAALAHAAVLQFHPVNTDVLPVFVICHVLFAPLLWLLLRAPNLALGLSLSLYVLVHVFGWNIPAWPDGVWFFNPLAWQLPVVLGAWYVIEGRTIRGWVTSRPALVLSALYLAFGLVVALGHGIMPPLLPQALTDLLLPMDKSNLSPLRLLHFLTLAILASWLVPAGWRGLSTPMLRSARRCGENSLPIYCLGVLLALASQCDLFDISNRLSMQIGLSLAGVVAMAVVATLLNTLGTKRARPLDGDTAGHDLVPHAGDRGSLDGHGAHIL
ncbi:MULTISPECIES: OpgC domain-containing protein [Bradyrhizobium]|uniref:OpgC domain-containing protein n=1 Tax=Bradyrhizobium elkanii TaxID=29448 RepID=A0A4U6RL89_BRAEL|nr:MULTISPECIES: OpgC domain-containing protein [Bradyrhizobium]MTV15837.1 OpgC domain-containing protein [Bradyrhizobium sp. BR2003]TKV73316.1 OpgC domain-containing protein [Bradyrhizobium elkanii]